MDRDYSPEVGHLPMDEPWTPPRSISQGTFVVCVFLVMVGLTAVATAVVFTLLWLFPVTAQPTDELHLPWSFAVSTVLLGFGSFAQHRSLSYVRIEKQRPFRRWLMVATIVGTLFLTMQSYGLWSLLATQIPGDAQTGVNAFVFVLSLLHALHVGVAMMFLVFVTLRGLTDRYDHEYYWGVVVCACLWDALGLIWLFILAIFVVAV